MTTLGETKRIILSAKLREEYSPRRGWFGTEIKLAVLLQDNDISSIFWAYISYERFLSPLEFKRILLVA